MKRFIKIYNDHNEVVDAVDNNELYIPYVAWLETPQIIDWNSYSGGPFVPSGGYATYLTFTSMADDNTVSFSVGANLRPNQATRMELSTDSGATWSGITIDGENDQTLSVTVNSGDTVWWRGTANRWNANGTSSPARFNATKNYIVSGNILSILYGSEFRGQKEIPNPYDWNNRFFAIFSGSTTLIDASELLMPEGIIYNACCERMFYNCTNLAAAPDLPATTLVGSAYASMFQGCTSLTNMPTIGATRVSNSWSFSRMFQDCTGLTGATNMSVTGVNGSEYAFEYMFLNCRSLLNAPTLPATNLSGTNAIYVSMFSNCTSLTTPPVLPATTLAESCYEKMFSGCTGLTTAPSVLPALECPQRGYNDMFINCTSLVTAPAIMATGATGAYSMAGMFLGCTSLVNVPDMHLMTFGWLSTCEGMFDGCTSLVKAPLLPASTLEGGCYYHMFAGCTSLSAVTCLATDISGTNRWLENVAPTGVFTKASGATGWTIDSPDGIPSGWTVRNYEDPEPTPEPEPHSGYSDQYLTIKSREANNTIEFNSGITGLYMSLDGENWTAASSVTINSGDTVMLKRNDVNSEIHNALVTAFDENFDVEGNIMSLIYGDNFSGQTVIPTVQTGTGYFYRLFYNNPIVNAGNLVIPATTFGQSCFEDMFEGCVNLITAPELPATTLKRNCYLGMFKNCSSLTTAPELPATTLAQGCYMNMFAGCSSLTTPPELSATALTDGCYSMMFNYCTSLTEAPVLPATTVGFHSYKWMFSGCTSLSAVTCLAEDISEDECVEQWLAGVSATGTFTKAVNMSGWSTGVNGIPSGWTVNNYTN